MPEKENNNDSIRDVSRSSMRRTRRTVPSPQRRRNTKLSSQSTERKEPVQRRSSYRKNKGAPIGLIVGIIGVIIVLAVGLLSTTFATYTLSLKLAVRDISIESKKFSASRVPLQTGDLLFELSSPIEIERSRTEVADGKTDIETKARGTLIVFNTYTDPLKLVGKTRFQSNDNDFVYLLQGRQTIPAGTTRAGTFTPGELVVTVEAREKGTDRNIEKKNAQFAIPGLKDSGKYKDAYAVLKTSIKGGIDDARFYINRNREKKIQKELENEVREALLKQIDEEIEKREGYVYFKDAIIFEFKDLDPGQGDNTLTYQKHGIAHIFIFRAKNIAKLLDTVSTPLYKISPDLLLSDTKDLSFSIEKKENINVDTKEFIFTLGGTGTVAWDINKISIFEKIKGKKEKDIGDDIKDQYPFIEDITQSKLFPFWISTIPKTRSKFTFIKTYYKPSSVQTSEEKD